MNKQLIWNTIEELEKAIATTAEVAHYIEPGPHSPTTHAQYQTILQGVKVMAALRSEYLAIYKTIEELERKALESLQGGHTNGSS